MNCYSFLISEIDGKKSWSPWMVGHDVWVRWESRGCYWSMMQPAPEWQLARGRSIGYSEEVLLIRPISSFAAIPSKRKHYHAREGPFKTQEVNSSSLCKSLLLERFTKLLSLWGYIINKNCWGRILNLGSCLQVMQRRALQRYSFSESLPMLGWALQQCSCLWLICPCFCK